jgi:nitroreductase
VTARPASSATRESAAAGFFDLARRRRVCRSFGPQPVSEAHLWLILEAARWASNASNVRIHRFLVTRDADRIRTVRSVSPGMLGDPTALVVICTDLDAAAACQVKVDQDSTVLIDVGTAAMNMMLAAEALGLGACPLTSFSRTAVSEVLELPDHAIPEFMLQLGHRQAEPLGLARRPRQKISAADLAYWEQYGTRRQPSEALHTADEETERRGGSRS